jgi:hypothetical protein
MMREPSHSFRAGILLAVFALFSAPTARADTASLTFEFTPNNFESILQQPEGTDQEVKFAMNSVAVVLRINGNVIAPNLWEFDPDQNPSYYFQLDVSFKVANAKLDVVNVDPITFNGAIGNQTNDAEMSAMGDANIYEMDTDAFMDAGSYDQPVTTIAHYITDNGPNQYRTFIPQISFQPTGQTATIPPVRVLISPLGDPDTLYSIYSVNSISIVPDETPWAGFEVTSNKFVQPPEGDIFVSTTNLPTPRPLLGSALLMGLLALLRAGKLKAFSACRTIRATSGDTPLRHFA